MVDSLRELIGDENYSKLEELRNPHVMRIVERYVRLCKPAKVSVITDDPDEIAYVRELAIRNGEEMRLRIEGHTIHYDGYYDQARDKEHTRVLLPPGMRISPWIKTIDRDEGLREVHQLLDGAMRGKEMLVRFFCLGPRSSRFSICALQLTDSAYVAHSEDLLYRTGYEEFKKLRGSSDFFAFIHSAGELDERGCSKNVDKRRIYIDLIDGKVYSVNNQYAGNSLGLKKLALRLAIYKSHQEGWLTEHMLIMGVHPPGKGRVTYFTGAFPSACGKTSTAMLPGNTIVGDDIAYIRIDEEGNARAVNIECGIFGIIKDVNPIDDPVIYKALTTPKELIFSNVLVVDGVPYWLGMGREFPKRGINHSGEWWEGKLDEEGNPIPPAHPNARYTLRLRDLENVDPRLEDPEGVIVEGILFGGRDSDTNVPIYEAFNWEHGVYVGATIESETTPAALEKVGVRKINPMAMLDFLVIPVGKYLSDYIEFGRRLKRVPRVYATNYFLKHEGRYLNDKLDKKVWILWAEGRIHNEYDALKTPVGYLPRYEDLKPLFREALNKDYRREDYELQFSLRIDKLLERMKRIEEFYGSEPDMPEEFWRIHNQIKSDLKALREESGRSMVPPSYFE